MPVPRIGSRDSVMREWSAKTCGTSPKVGRERAVMTEKTKDSRGRGHVVKLPVQPTHEAIVVDEAPPRVAGMATHLWVLDVLGNLRAYADGQGLSRLSAALAECGDVALDELRAQQFGHPGPAPEDV